ncbi:hypothetical protein Tco_0545996 [Tanacetum coccineum]
MSIPKFAETHNLVAFLEKPEESNGFKEVIDFLNASSFQYMLTMQALVDKKKVIISETSIRSDLKLDDAKGTDCLPTATIFSELERMGAKTTSWNEFSSTMEFAIISTEDMGTDSATSTDSHSIPIITQPSSSKPQKKKLRRKQRKDSAPSEPTTKETTLEEHVSTPSYDPPLSGKDRMQLAELMSLCTNLQEKGIKFEKVVEEPVVSVATTTRSIPVSATEVVTTASASVEIPDELTLAQTLIEIETAKPKPVTTAATTVRPRAKGIIFHDQEEQVPASTKTFYSLQSQLLQVKDKGKGKMVEPEVPLKKKDQVALDEEMARNLEA